MTTEKRSPYVIAALAELVYATYWDGPQAEQNADRLRGLAVSAKQQHEAQRDRLEVVEARVQELEFALKRIQASADLVPECRVIRAILRELDL